MFVLTAVLVIGHQHLKQYFQSIRKFPGWIYCILTEAEEPNSGPKNGSRSS